MLLQIILVSIQQGYSGGTVESSTDLCTPYDPSLERIYHDVLTRSQVSLLTSSPSQPLGQHFGDI